MVKNALSDPALLGSFLERFVPPPVAPLLAGSTIRFCDSEAEGIRRTRRHFDLVVEVVGNDGSFRVQILVEHKSWRDPGSLFQILEYKVALWSRQRRQGRALTPVLPILFYHGETPWGLSGSFQGVYGFSEEFRSVCVDFSPVIVDTASEDESALLDGVASLKTALFLVAMKYARDRERMERAIRKVLEERFRGEVLDPDSVFLVDMLNFYSSVFEVDDRSELEQVFGSLFGKEAAMTAVEKIRQEGIETGRMEGRIEGRQEGRIEGRQEGRIEGRQEGRMEGSVETREDFVKKLLAKGTMSPEEISRTLDLDLLWVKELADSLRKA